MGGSDPISNVVRFVLLLFVQVILFRQVSLGLGGAASLAIIVSPLFIALLPLRTPLPLVVVFSFLLGFGTDLFYESLGVHMAAATFTGYARQFVLRLLEPRDGFKVKASPEGRDLGFSWWMKYVGMMLGVYLIWYFSMEAFSPVFWRSIALKTVVSLPVSWVVCMVFVTLLRPRI
ncbi:hypothetical protein [Neolewinella antarctica]|uniref:Rod shape-determining protein MreD n=1 Tax=Neolewinella antarctica TaxID=442734 RepID=A0ABX0XAN8_9BACT|nr:hypothetical protein [Neolewinella antarctica]NJC26321.1 hypothetical protein [Neolewinella antarctica]